jgi:hypothetical protein
MKTLKILFFVALFTPWVSRAAATPFHFQETVLTAEKLHLAELNTSTERSVFTLPVIDKNSINNQRATFLISQVAVKRFPGAAITNSGGAVVVPNAVNVKRSSTNQGVSKVVVSKAVIRNVTTAGDSFFLNFNKNDSFNNPFTSPELAQIATDTNNTLAANFETTTDPITVTFQGTTESFKTLEAANIKMSEIISTNGLEKGPVRLNIYGVIVGYGIIP